MRKPYQEPIVCLFGILLLLSFQIPNQENQLLQNIIDELIIYSQNGGAEKTYLHTDKDFYTNGETIWFKTYLVDGITHKASSKSTVVYVELLDVKDSIVEQRKLYVDAIGASGDIQIGDKITPGDYYLRSYTKFMLNNKEHMFFEKKIPILVQKIESDVNLENPLGSDLSAHITNDEKHNPSVLRPIIRFFPEGGQMVEGLSGVLGIEVTDAKGNGVALLGDIKDMTGEAVSHFESSDFGLGKTHFMPSPNKQYYASIMIDGREQKFALPEAISKGYVLSVKNRDDTILVQVKSSTNDGVKGTLLIGHLRGNLIFKRIGQEVDEDSYAVKLFTKELLDGVAQFTLFTPNGEPVCERLVFVDNPKNDLKLSVLSASKSYGLREKVSMDVALTDTKGTPLKGNFSMGVVTQNNYQGDNAMAANIKSWLLLDSDLGGTVQEAGYFFKDDSKERKHLLDALMLTHGWRRFVWNDILSEKGSKTFNFPAEKGIMITGRTTAFNNQDKPKKTLATLSILGEEIIHSQKSTNKQGEFSFGPFVYVDSITGIVQAADTLRKRNSMQKHVSVFMDSPWPKIDVKNMERKRVRRQTIVDHQEYLKESYREKIIDFQYNPKVTQLEEVVVKEYRKTRTQIINEAMDSDITFTSPSNRVYIDSILGSKAFSALDLLRRVAGVQVFGSYPFESVQIRGVGSINASNGPLFLVDGFAVDPEVAQTMRASEVMFIDVVKGPDAALWGSRGANGVVAIYTDRGFRFDDRPEEEVPGITNFKLPGFHKVREFYSPNYIIPQGAHEKPDYRTTLFWEPNIELDENGKSSIRFHTGDNTGKYVVKIEGITNDGRPIHGIYNIEVQESN